MSTKKDSRYWQEPDEYVSNTPSTRKAEDVLFEIPLPTMEKFASRSRKDDHCPYIKFQRYVTKQLKRKHGIDPFKANISISDIVITTDTATELNKRVIRWIPYFRRYLKNGYKGFTSAYGMMHLQAAPTSDNADFMKDNVVYVFKSDQQTIGAP